MSSMKKCSSCDAEIAASAKQCPSCGAKQKKPIYKRWWVWAIVAVVAISVFSSGGDKPSTVSKTEEQKVEETVFKIGDVISTDKFELSVASVETRNVVGSPYFTSNPSEGGIYVVVNWDMKNITTEPISSFSCPTLYLQDKNGTKYESDISATSNYAIEVDLDRKILSDLNPNIKVKDAQVFEISEESYNAGGFSILISADDKIVIPVN